MWVLRISFNLCFEFWFLTLLGTSILDFAFSVPHRELARAADHRDEVQRHLHHFGDSQSVDEYCDLLRKTVLVLPILSRDPRVLEGAGSVIWHTDLHLGNIYASDDPTTIEGVIDLAVSASCSAIYTGTVPWIASATQKLQCRNWNPHFTGRFWRARSRSKGKGCWGADISGSVWILWDVLPWIQQGYLRCNEAGSAIVEALHLLPALPKWLYGSTTKLSSTAFPRLENMGLPGSCPFEFAEDDLQRHSEQVQHYQDTVYLWDIVKGQLHTDNSG